jgi:ABC-type uncharacterized transport system ATPase subunit
MLDEPFSGLGFNTAFVLGSLLEQRAARRETVLYNSLVLDVLGKAASPVLILAKAKWWPIGAAFSTWYPRDETVAGRDPRCAV